MAASLATLARHSIFTSARNSAAKAGEAGAHAGGSKQWKMVSILVALPAIALCNFNAFTGDHGHRPEFIPYEHLRLRTKRFPWGDGSKSLFHNSHANALPGGYEGDEEH